MSTNLDASLDVTLLDSVLDALGVSYDELNATEGVPTTFCTYLDRAVRSLLDEPGLLHAATLVTPRKVCQRAIWLIDRDMVGQHGWRAHVLTATRRLFARID